MIDAARTILLVIALPLTILGVVEFVQYPLALLAEFRSKRTAPPSRVDRPLVTIVVPAYNEAMVLTPCIDSIIADRYPNKEIILVDDGSSDATIDIMRRYEHRPDVIVLSQGNRGKGAALNTGIDYGTGLFYFFVDADGVFSPNTIEAMLERFSDAHVGGVCGNDEPVNLDRHQTRLLALLTHGTALVRRALAHIGCLTIVSGNCGAFRRDVVHEVRGFAEGSLGEDLELTWRVAAAGYRIEFAPRALVYSEVPNTLRGLWNQRVRWTRGLVETARRHRHLVGRTRNGRLGLYLVHNLVTMLIVPLL
jgi:poly-beta-1,6-N-acetyl-D-glucosamine synthase